MTQVAGERLAGPEQDRPVLALFFLVTRRCGCTKIARDVLEGRSHATTEGQGRGMLTSTHYPRNKVTGKLGVMDVMPGTTGSEGRASH